MRGTLAKEARRKSAIQRLEKHLQDHKANHIKDMERFTDNVKNSWERHDSLQKAELARLKTI